jgi:hypothetical protein
MDDLSADLLGIPTLLKYSENVDGDVEFYGFRLCYEMACQSNKRAVI